MEHYAGIDVSLELSSVCVVDTQGRIVKEVKVASDAEDLIAFFASLGFARIGLEAGPLSQWLQSGLKCAGLEVVLLETRHVKAALSAMTVKTDRKDARGIDHAVSPCCKFAVCKFAACKFAAAWSISISCRKAPRSSSVAVRHARSRARRPSFGGGG